MPAGFLSEDMEFPGQMWAFLSDRVRILSGSIMGTTSLTVYVESAAGIEVGVLPGACSTVTGASRLASNDCQVACRAPWAGKSGPPMKGSIL